MEPISQSSRIPEFTSYSAPQISKQMPVPENTEVATKSLNQISGTTYDDLLRKIAVQEKECENIPSVDEKSIRSVMDKNAVMLFLAIAKGLKPEAIEKCYSKPNTEEDFETRMLHLQEVVESYQELAETAQTGLDSALTVVFAAEQFSKSLEKLKVSATRVGDIVIELMSLSGIAGVGAMIIYEASLLSHLESQKKLLEEYLPKADENQKQPLQDVISRLDEWIKTRRTELKIKGAKLGLSAAKPVFSISRIVLKILIESGDFSAIVPIISPMAAGLFVVGGTLGIIGAGQQVYKHIQLEKDFSNWDMDLEAILPQEWINEAQGNKKLRKQLMKLYGADNKEELDALLKGEQEKIKTFLERQKQLSKELLESTQEEFNAIHALLTKPSQQFQSAFEVALKDSEKNLREQGYDVEGYQVVSELMTQEKLPFFQAVQIYEQWKNTWKDSGNPYKELFENALENPLDPSSLKGVFAFQQLSTLHRFNISIKDANEVLLSHKKDLIKDTKDLDRTEVKKVVQEQHAQKKKSLGTEVKNALRTLAKTQKARLSSFITWKRVKIAIAVISAVVILAVAITSMVFFPPSLVPWVILGVSVVSLLTLGAGVAYEVYNRPNISLEIYSWSGFVNQLHKLQHAYRKLKLNAAKLEDYNKRNLFKKIHIDQTESEDDLVAETRKEEIKRLEAKVKETKEKLDAFEKKVQEAASKDFKYSRMYNKELLSMLGDLPENIIKMVENGKFSKEDLQFVKERMGFDLEGINRHDLSEGKEQASSLINEFLGKSLDEMRSIMKRQHVATELP